MRKSRFTAPTLTAVLVGAYFAATASTPTTSDDATMVLISRNGEKDYGSMHFALSGRSVQSLYPGATRQMKLTVVNPYGFRLRLQRLTGKVITSSRRGCSPTAANLAIKEYDGLLPVTVHAHQRVTMAGSIPVTMPRSATEKCAGSRFIIMLSGWGGRAER
jgi:hypothetical protein